MRRLELFYAAPRPFNPWTAPRPAPRRDVRLLAPGFETRAAAHAEQVRRRLQLFRHGGMFHAAMARSMRACRRRGRCLVAACPKCTRRYRVWLAGEVLRLFAGEDDLIFVTVIPPRAAAPAGGLLRCKAKRPMDWLRQLLRRLGCDGVVVGGLDGTFEKDAGEWQPHFHLIAPARLRPVFEEVRRYCAATPTGSAPVVVEEVVHRPGMATYCCKGFWPERVRWVDTSGARRTGKRRLAKPEHLEWLAWRGMQGLTDLTFLYGVRRRGGRIVRSP